ncbi:guanylate-binding protein 5-like [Mercenaria mercenaria]|uniref:guanylate-binding protein 5-like n=1 Tax=Mercenaria mercenaria TaxID=6596 RepID=UPI00234FB57D|nr:guanylate-binding protein 5-like [Mercenaria mercenaria]
MMKGGEEITDDEYLEHCLESIAGDREVTEQTNKTRTFLKRKFPVRKCFTFDRPAGRKKLRELESLRDKDLSEAFIEDADKFVRYIYGRKPKLLPERVAVDGKIFSCMLVQHVDSLTAGAIPDIQDALTRVVEKENKELVRITKAAYSQEMYVLRSKPMSSASFNEKSDQIIQSLMDEFREKVRFDSYHKFENLAKNSLEMIKESSRHKNSKKIFKHCYSVVKKLYDERIRDGSQFFTIGGHQDYREEIEQLKEQYDQECRHLDYKQADWAFMALINERSTTERNIVMEDCKLRKEKDYHNIDQLRREQENQRLEARRKVETFQQQEEVNRERDKEAQRQEFNQRDKALDAYATETRNRLPPGY